jgi:hypothetical protein
VIATGTGAQIRSDRTVQAAYLGFSDADALDVPDDVAAQATQILGAPILLDETMPMPAVRTEQR